MMDFSLYTDATPFVTLEFQLTTGNSNESQKCSQFSRYYCLLAWHSEFSFERLPRRTDEFVMYSLARANFKKLNWFDLYRDNTDDCCDFQLSIYKLNGQLHGISPREYMKKMSDFGQENKHLNYIKADYDSSNCVNVIERLGFGSDVDVILDGDIRIGVALILVQPTDVTDASIHLFMPDFLPIKFDWFKQNFICMDHPAYCRDY
ncbi:uncharacterized protein LOC142350726 isoform X2 [Convolutriloba macropyga]